MSIEDLADNARALVAAGKGILAIDESGPTIARRFADVGLPNSEANRRAYRELLITAPGLAGSISGVALSDETIRQSTSTGVPFARYLDDQGILAGIKVDKGSQPLAGCPGEVVTEGLDGLRQRLEEYRKLGARFAKWRAVIRIGEGIPTGTCIESNSHALARFAALAQEQGLVPMVEPEVLMEGDHDLDTSYEVHEVVLRSLFDALYQQNVMLDATLLKPSMVLPGSDGDDEAGVDEVAEATLTCIRSTVPAIVPGILFLSGGQDDERATAHLDAMNRMGPHPWVLSFSYGRALQSAALQVWAEDPASNAGKAQDAVIRRARANALAALGRWERARA
ncbi:fructose-bisphosphate aldolase class I [Luteimonas sp. J16]|uniref:class I fructose-bisphosphate aldolase n=1 Tax=unclassified Luteimonas TaxID=2629088 RepID=UPI0004797604|nr:MULTISPECIES: class I fructose-bisphosphate aldolase [unclassified Luteimonas]TWG94336.1 fructose-bisphosphate aldolase class I [Luteimonas sp. J16]